MGTKVYFARYKRRPKQYVHVEYTGWMKVVHGCVMAMKLVLVAVGVVAMVVGGIVAVIAAIVGMFLGEQDGRRQ